VLAKVSTHRFYRAWRTTPGASSGPIGRGCGREPEQSIPPPHREPAPLGEPAS